MEQDINVNLKWDAHHATLKSVFDTLLDTESLADCTLGAEDQHLKAHKVMLSACSQYFELLFRNHYEKHIIIILPGVQFPILKALVEFMYRGEVLVPQDKIDDLLQLADFLQVKGLSHCGNVLTEKKTVDKIRNKSTSSHCHASPESYEHSDSPEVLEVSGSSSHSESFHKDDYTKVSPTSTPVRKRKKSDLNSSRGEPQQDVVDQLRTVSRNLALQRTEVLDKSKSAQGMFSDPEHIPSLESQLPVFSEGNFSERTLSIEEFISPKPWNTMVRKSVCPIVREDSTNLETFAELKQENCSLDDVILVTDENKHLNDCDDNSFVFNELNESSSCDEESISQQLHFQHGECPNRDTTEQVSATNNRFKCPSCVRSYCYQKDLYRHLKRECGKEPQFKCPHCLHRSTYKYTLKAHMIAKHSDLLNDNLQS